MGRIWLLRLAWRVKFKAIFALKVAAAKVDVKCVGAARLTQARYLGSKDVWHARFSGRQNLDPRPIRPSVRFLSRRLNLAGVSLFAGGEPEVSF